MTYEGTIVSTFGAIVLRRCEIRTARLGLGKGDFTSLFRRSIESAHAARLLKVSINDTMSQNMIIINVLSPFIYLFTVSIFLF